ncbi:neurotrophin 1-like [Neocloeon triangulifer]|uniref:neurotrophin 1-like n=1 Tax=Neocloeon triangulifer TaxID=2078957 RepID=UPI00286F9DD6|nr:neurotrophin 1-like [Neocloeon triangulifer]
MLGVIFTSAGDGIANKMISLQLVFLVAMLSPQALHGRPHDREFRGCNMTLADDLMIEERSSRPDYPDPAQKSADKEPSSRVIFPGPIKTTPSFANSGIISSRTTVFLPNVPPMERGPSCADGSTFCEEPDNYPKEYISNLLKQDKMVKGLFGQDDLSSIILAQRIDSSDEQPLCPSQEHVAYPKTAQNKDDKWLYIINQEDFVQGIRVEKCINKETRCLLSENLPNGYVTTCKQKYIYRKLVSLNDEGRALTDSFKIPSCCACHYRMTSIASRMGVQEKITPVVIESRIGQKDIVPAAVTSAQTSRSKTAKS